MNERYQIYIYLYIMLDHLVDLIRDLNINSIKFTSLSSNKSQQILISFDDCSENKCIHICGMYIWMVNQTE